MAKGSSHSDRRPIHNMEDFGEEQVNNLNLPVRPAQHSLTRCLSYTGEHLAINALYLPCHAQSEQPFQFCLCGDIKPRTYYVEQRADARIPELKHEVVIHCHHSPSPLASVNWRTCSIDASEERCVR